MAEEFDDDRTLIPSRPAGGSPAIEMHNNALRAGTRMAEFEILDLIGEGGFAMVYRAMDHSLQRTVALKEFMPATLAARGNDASVSVRSERQRETFMIGLRSFINEARILARFDHPALVKVYRFWEANGTAYMAMPLLQGSNLLDVLRARPDAPPEAWIKQVITPLMEALALIHGEQIYHRDIAPDNIMLADDDRPILLDFGAARHVISDMTQALTVILKPGYAPIEQYAEMPGMKQGPWTDVYGLAATMYFMILGRKPPAAVARTLKDEYQSLLQSEAVGHYSERLLVGIDRCLSVRSEDRAQSMNEMREMVGFGQAVPTAAAVLPQATPPDAALRTEPRLFTTAPSTGPGRTVEPTAPVTAAPAAAAASAKSGKPWLMGGVGLGAVAVALGGYSWFASKDGTREQVQNPGLSGAASAPAAVQAAASDATAVTASTPVTPSAATNAASTPSAGVQVSAATPSATAVPAPPAANKLLVQQPFSKLTDALDAAVTASDPAMDFKLDIGPRLSVGMELKASGVSPVDGFLYLFAWDEADNKVYRLRPNNKESDIVVKANVPFALPRQRYSGAGLRAREPLGGLRVVALLSSAERGLSRTAFQLDDALPVANRDALEGNVGKAGLASLFGTPVCVGQPGCTDTFAVKLLSVTKTPAPPPAAAATTAPGPSTTPGPSTAAAPQPAPKPAPPPIARATPSSPPASAAGASERDYVKRLNKDLDELLGK